jgi:hypothetical protein
VPTDSGSGKPHSRRPRPSEPSPGSRLRATPGARQAPAGLERARRRHDAPPRPTRQAPPPRRPDLPVGEDSHLPRVARREIERVLGKGARADDVALALSVGSDAIDVGRIDVALEALTWAKHEASRVAVIREALGVARYLDEDFAGALTELQAYRRISGRVDQNHLIADSLRAVGRDTDRIIEPLEELLADDRVPDDRRAEAIIIWAATLADDGDLEGARALLRRHLGRDGASEGATHDLRVRVLAAELADRAGDAAEARAHRAAVARAEPELLEIADLSGTSGSEGSLGRDDAGSAEAPELSELVASGAAGDGDGDDEAASSATEEQDEPAPEARGDGPDREPAPEARGDGPERTGLQEQLPFDL